MSLVQVMIAMGLMSVIGLGVAELMTTSAKISQRTDLKLSELVLINEIKSIISSQDACTTMTQGQVYDHGQGQTGGGGWDITFNIPGAGAIASNTNFDNKLRIDRLFLDEVTPIPTTDPAKQTYLGKIKLQANTDANNRTMGGELREKEVSSMYFTVNLPGNDIDSCVKEPEYSVNQLCKDLGGTYDPTKQSCTNFKFADCTSLTHGQSDTIITTTPGQQCYESITCVDGQEITTSKWCETNAEQKCLDLGGTYNSTTKTCSNYQFANCGGLSHGQSTTNSYKSGGRQCHRSQMCIDGQTYTTSEFCEEKVAIPPPSGPSGSECTPGTTRNVSGSCPSDYSGGKQRQNCIDGYWVDSGGVFGCSWSCFIAETTIKMHNYQELPISQVQIGDYVMGEDGAINEVYDIEVVPLGGRQLFSFNDGPHFVTAEHPFKTTLGWKSFSPDASYYEHAFMVDEIPLEAGDLLLREGKNVEMLKKISTRHDKSNLMVYNLRLKAAPMSPYDNSDDRSNTYFANGYLVHNK